MNLGGFPEEDVKYALEKCNGIPNLAADMLFQGYKAPKPEAEPEAEPEQEQVQNTRTLYVEPLNAPVIQLEVVPDVTVGAIKNMISQREVNGQFYEPEEQRIVYSGKSLDDNQTLDEFVKKLILIVNKKEAEPAQEADAEAAPEPEPEPEPAPAAEPAAEPEPEAETRKLYIKTMGLGNIELNVVPHIKVWGIKNKICQKMKWQYDMYDLMIIFQGENLDDNKTLCECGYGKNHHSLTLIRRKKEAEQEPVQEPKPAQEAEPAKEAEPAQEADAEADHEIEMYKEKLERRQATLAYLQMDSGENTPDSEGTKELKEEIRILEQLVGESGECV